jgi:Na+/melibiose symporter-like transporter
MFGMFFFITLFVQNVLGYTPIESGLSFLPVSAAIFVAAGIASRFLPRFGPKPFMITGVLLAGAGMIWLTFIDTGSTYVTGVLGPTLLFGFGMGLNFVTLTLTAVSGVAQEDSGAASGLLNATQQVGGSLGLSILVTVFGTASRNEATTQVPKFLSSASPEQQAQFAQTKQLPAPWGHEVLASGISHAFMAGVGLFAAAFLVALVVVRVRKTDLDRLRGQQDGAPAATH